MYVKKSVCWLIVPHFYSMISLKLIFFYIIWILNSEDKTKTERIKRYTDFPRAVLFPIERLDFSITFAAIKNTDDKKGTYIYRVSVRTFVGTKLVSPAAA